MTLTIAFRFPSVLYRLYRLGYIVFLLILLAHSPCAYGTSFVEQPLEETIRHSPLIVRGQIGSISTDWSTTETGERSLFTFYELQIHDVLKGSAPNGQGSLIMRQLGGEKDGIAIHIPGSAEFRQGEEVVVFLNDTPEADGSFALRGLMLSKLEISRNEAGEETLSGPAISGTAHAHHHRTDQDTRKKKNSIVFAEFKAMIEQQNKTASQKTEKANQPNPQPTATSVFPREAQITQNTSQQENLPQPQRSKTPTFWILSIAAGIGISALIGLTFLKKRKKL